jgi:predicted HAD superfamily Cof-like phosphohydrolase
MKYQPMAQTTEHYDRVREFMDEAQQDTPPQPTVPDFDTRRLRAMLILEEALETIEALGIDLAIEIKLGDDILSMENFQFLESESGPDLEEIADGCADISVVTTGTLIACGIADSPLLEEVDRANLDKFGPGHSYSEAGKLIKPDDFEDPDIAGVLQDQVID